MTKIDRLLIDELFRIFGESNVHNMSSLRNELKKNNDLQGIRTTDKIILRSFCQYQLHLGNLRSDNSGKSPKKPSRYKTTNQYRDLRRNISQENTQIKIREKFNHKEQKNLQLTFGWIRTHVIINGKIIEVDPNATIKLNNCENELKDKQQEKFSCDFKDEDSLQRYEKNIPKYAHLACDGEPILDEFLKDPILLKIESESQ
jgi:hypothetical protein